MPSFIGYIPTHPEYIEGFFNLVTLNPSDTVYDLGCGDGRLLFAALEKGAGKIVGVELYPELVRRDREKAARLGIDDRAAFIEDDFLNVQIGDATVVFCYVSVLASDALKPKFLAELRPGTRVVMETFPVMGWRPVKTYTIDYKEFFLYVMPPDTAEKDIPVYGSDRERKF